MSKRLQKCGAKIVKLFKTSPPLSPSPGEGGGSGSPSLLGEGFGERLDI